MEEEANALERPAVLLEPERPRRVTVSKIRIVRRNPPPEVSRSERIVVGLLCMTLQGPVEFRLGLSRLTREYGRDATHEGE